MPWIRPVLSFSQGAAITLGSTAISCALALQVEQSAHRFFFWMAPHWYAPVTQAYGLTEEDLQHARLVAQQRDMKQLSYTLTRLLADENAIVVAAANEDRTTVSSTSSFSSKSSSLPSTTTTTATTSGDVATAPRYWWNKVRIPSDEERILESAPL